MTKNNDGWGSKWPTSKASGVPWPNDLNIITEQAKIAAEEGNAKFFEKLKIIGWDKGTDDKATIVKIADEKVAYIGEFKSQGSNLVDTDAYLYFQCDGCQTILDPSTKSFAKLQEQRVSAGWVCKWNVDGMGYKVYCVECGEKVK